MAAKDKFAKVKNIAARYTVATFGLAFVAIGIAFAVLSNLGVSALNGVQYAFANKFPRFSFGDFNFGIFSRSLVNKFFYVLIFYYSSADIDFRIYQFRFNKFAGHINIDRFYSQISCFFSIFH